MDARGLLRRLTLALTLVVGGAFAIPEPVEAAPQADSVCKRKKRRSKRRRKKKLSAKTIKRWQKKGLSNERIVEKARARGYKVTKRERRKLKRARVRKSLIAALAAPAAKRVAAPSGPQPIDIEKTIDPNEIDFDSVAPPEGMDMRYADLHRAQSN